MSKVKKKDNKKEITVNEPVIIKHTRNSALDVIRIVALFCVIAVHFFLNNGFYETSIGGKRILIMVLMRTAFMISVPLFLLLTGYLMRKKELSKKYYSGIKKTLSIYILASLACLIYKVLFLNMNYSLFGIIKDILGFSLAKYSWYIEMYIGLFLLIPFLNLIYNNLKTKKEKQTLILTLLLLTSIPTITNIFNFNGKIGWEIFFDSSSSNKILPFWWNSIYPITYYFIGAYLSEFKIKISKLLNIGLIIGSVLIFGLHNYFYSYGKFFNTGIHQNWGAIQNVITSVLVFVFILNINFDKLNNNVKKVLKKISDCCLGAYLVSFIFDDYLYKILNSNVAKVSDKLNYFVIIVPVIFVCSIILSLLLNLLYDLLIKTFGKIKAKKLNKEC